MNVRQILTNLLVIFGMSGLSSARALQLDSSIDSLIARLASSPDEAEERLLTLGAKAIPALERALSEENPDIRERAACVLGEMGAMAAPATDSLINLFEDDFIAVRRQAALSLASIGEPAILRLDSAIESKNHNVRWYAAFALGSFPRWNDSVGGALLKGLRDFDDSEVRLQSASGLTLLIQSERRVAGTVDRIGDDLIRAIANHLSDSNDEVRLELAESLTSLEGRSQVALPELLGALSDGRSAVRERIGDLLAMLGPNVVDKLIVATNVPDWNIRCASTRALGKLPNSGEATISALIERIGDEREEVRMEALVALRGIGAAASPALPALCKTAIDDTDPNIRRFAIQALAAIDSNAEISVETLRHIAGTLEEVEGVRLEAYTAIVLGQAEGWRALPDVVKGIRMHPATVRSAAADTIGAFPSHAHIATQDLLEMLAIEKSPNARQAYVRTLGKIAPTNDEVVASLCEAISDPNYEVRLEAIQSLSNLGPAAACAVDTLSPNLASTDWNILVRVISALRSIGPSARSTVPILIQLLQHDDTTIAWDSAEALVAIGIGEEDLRRAFDVILERLSTLEKQDDVFFAGRALGALAEHASNNGSTKLLGSLQKASEAVNLAESEVPAESKRRFNRFVRHPVNAAYSSVRSLSRQRLWIRFGFLTAVICLALGFTIVFMISVRVQRLIAIYVLQRRWLFATVPSNYVAKVLPISNGARVEIESVDAALPVVSHQDISCLHRLPRRMFKFPARSNVRVVVAPSLFERPWAVLIGDNWSEGLDATIAGQQCLTNSPILRPPYSKDICFATVKCGETANGRPALKFSDVEVDSAEHCFREWGATVYSFGGPSRLGAASLDDFRTAMELADVVHVTAHASSMCIFLANGETVTTESLSDSFLKKMRCRLMFLSACDAGTLTQGDAFVRRLVEAGVNVLAATTSIRDPTIQVFFEKFYSALLPVRQAGGVTIADAIRSAAESCTEYFESPNFRYLNQNVWKESVDSLILYGDPMSHFRLQSTNDVSLGLRGVVELILNRYKIRSNNRKKVNK